MLLRPTRKIIDFIKGFEKCKHHAYLPTPNDRWTIGWGSTGPDVLPGMRWTQQECDARFDRDIEDFAKGVNFLVDGAPTSQCQFDALVSFAYNCGLDIDKDIIPEGLGDSTLLRKHRAGDHAGAAAEFLKWDKQKGVVLRGLTRRRQEESDIYRGLKW